MSTMRISIVNDQPSYAPGDTLQVSAAWDLDATPRVVLLRLFWYTQGKGSTDSTVAVEQAFAGPMASGKWTTSLTIPPDAVPSYNGRLMSVLWGIELLAEKKLGFARHDLVVSHTGVPLTPPL